MVHKETWQINVTSGDNTQNYTFYLNTPDVSCVQNSNYKYIDIDGKIFDAGKHTRVEKHPDYNSKLGKNIYTAMPKLEGPTPAPTPVVKDRFYTSNADSKKIYLHKYIENTCGFSISAEDIPNYLCGSVLPVIDDPDVSLQQGNSIIPLYLQKKWWGPSGPPIKHPWNSTTLKFEDWAKEIDAKTCISFSCKTSGDNTTCGTCPATYMPVYPQIADRYYKTDDGSNITTYIENACAKLENSISAKDIPNYLCGPVISPEDAAPGKKINSGNSIVPDNIKKIWWPNGDPPTRPWTSLNKPWTEASKYINNNTCLSFSCKTTGDNTTCGTCPCVPNCKLTGKNEKYASTYGENTCLGPPVSNTGCCTNDDCKICGTTSPTEPCCPLVGLICNPKTHKCECNTQV